MKDFNYFLTRMSRDFKKIAVTGVDLDKMRPNMLTFIDFVNGSFGKQLESYQKVLGDLELIQLDTVVDGNYKFILRGVDLKATSTFVENVLNNIDKFQGNEGTLRVMIGVYGLYSAFIVKLVDTYLGTVSAGKLQDPNYTPANIKLRDVGIDQGTLKYYKLFEDLRAKTLDEWQKIKFTANEEKYIISAIKRIFLIYGF